MICKIVGERRGDHIHARVFMGEDVDHLNKNGDLVFRVGEWQIFVVSLVLGSKRTMGHLTVIVDDPLEDAT